MGPNKELVDDGQDSNILLLGRLHVQNRVPSLFLHEGERLVTEALHTDQERINILLNSDERRAENDLDELTSWREPSNDLIDLKEQSQRIAVSVSPREQ
jgi:tRNA G18 (ribose-2'-O)-methylase SpoU